MAKDNVTEMGAFAEKQANDGEYVHVLARPFEYEGRTYEEFRFNYAKLTGRDLLAIEDELAARDIFIIGPEFSTAFIACLAAKAAGVSDDVLFALPYADFSAIRAATRNFMLGRV